MTNLAANAGRYLIRIMPDTVSKLLHAAIWSCCAVQLESEQTPISRTCHWFRSAALQCLDGIQFRTCCFVPVIFLLRDQWLFDWMMEQSNGHCFGQQQINALNLQIIKTLLTLELSQYRKSGTTFSSNEQVAASSNCSWLRSALCLCLPLQPAQAVLEPGPKSSDIDFEVKTFDFLLEQPSGVIARWLAGAQTWTQNITLPPDQRFVEIHLLLCPKINFLEFEFFLKRRIWRQWRVDINPRPPNWC